MRRYFGLGRALTPTLVFLSLLYITANAAPPLYDLKNTKYHGIGVHAADPAKYRLSRDIYPTEYNLEIRVVLDQQDRFQQFTAPGVVSITVEVVAGTEPQAAVRLHSETITILNDEIKVIHAGNKTEASAVRGFLEDKEAQIVTIQLETNLMPGARYIVQIPFIAPIPDGKNTSFGLYRSSYITNDGQTRYYALTDFESVDARRMTPCFDEPDMKANWTISVIRQKAYKSLSNTDLSSTIPDVEEGWDRDNYKTSNAMSTYLVAIAVSDYLSEEATPGIYNKPVKIWGPPPMMESPRNGGVYAANMSAEAMKFFEEYLKVEYTFPKMDKFAVQDFSAGAMENWGLNTYRIVRLMYFEEDSTIQDKVTMTNTISHELAHQWFGNLVTMRWWDDIWLNEGFATHFANLAATAVFPDSGWVDYVVVDSVQYAMQADVRATTHPVHYNGLVTPAETRLGFDTISYDKGASILRMVNAFLTENAFKEAIKNYLDTLESGNAAQDELFEHLQNAAGVPARLPTGVTVKQILDTWTLQSGFPVVTVTRSSDDPNVISVSQEQYVNDSRASIPRDNKWYVPITFQTKSVAYNPDTAPEWILNDNNPVQLTITPTSEEFLIINPEETGYYRVKYDNISYHLILNQLNEDHIVLNPKTRSALIDDHLNFAFAGYIPIPDGLSITTFLTKERDLVPWATFITNMAIPYRLLSRTGAFYYYRKYVRNLMNPALQAITLAPKKDDHVANVILLRNRLVEWTCNLDLKECVEFAKAEVQTWIQTPAQKPESLRIQPDLRPFVYCTAVAKADNKEDVFKFIIQRYTTAAANNESDTEQLSLLRALACSQEPSRLTQLIDAALGITTTLITIQDGHRVAAIQAVAGNTYGTSAVIDSLRDKTDSYIERLGVSSISSVVTTLANYLSSSSEIGDINRFISTNEGKLESILASLKTSSTTMENNKKWIANNYDSMRAWLIDHSG